MSNFTTKVNDVVAAAFECPICTETMHPPIKQCLTGHSLCYKCSTKMKCCPYCKEKILIPNNHSMERIHRYALLPCKNRSLGCIIARLGPLLKAHEEFCQYNTLKCPLEMFGCSWSGQFHDIMDHCTKKHSSSNSAGNKINLVCPINSESQCSFLIAKVYGELFLLQWNIFLRESCMHFSCTCIGPPENARKYSFRVRYSNSRNETEDEGFVQGVCQRRVFGEHISNIITLLLEPGRYSNSDFIRLEVEILQN